MSYARFAFLSRSPRPVNPQELWARVATPGPFIQWLEDVYPPGLMVKMVLFFYRWTFMYRHHAYGVEQHYDLSNAFYALFLDQRYMFYTCADFLTGDESLEDAQDNKAAHFVELLAPKPGERILDLGSGWGGMMQKIYEATGDKTNLVGYTLSHEQKRHVDERYGFRVELRDFITTDYEEGSFDKIFSIESLEAVRPNELLPLSRKLANALRPNGKIVHQVICQASTLPPPPLLTGGLAIFPGHELVSLKRLLTTFEDADLRIVRLFMLDYRPTLRAWFQRVADNAEEAVRLVGIRNYNRYLFYFAEAWRLFNTRDIFDVRVVLEPKRGAVPGQA